MKALLIPKKDLFYAPRAPCFKLEEKITEEDQRIFDNIRTEIKKMLNF